MSSKIYVLKAYCLTSCLINKMSLMMEEKEEKGNKQNY